MENTLSMFNVQWATPIADILRSFRALGLLPRIWCVSLHQVTQSVMAQNALTKSMTEG
jgi:hypothetical protein